MTRESINNIDQSPAFLLQVLQPTRGSCLYGGEVIDFVILKKKTNKRRLVKKCWRNRPGEKIAIKVQKFQVGQQPQRRINCAAEKFVAQVTAICFWGKRNHLEQSVIRKETIFCTYRRKRLFILAKFCVIDPVSWFRNNWSAFNWFHSLENPSKEPEIWFS